MISKTLDLLKQEKRQILPHILKSHIFFQTDENNIAGMIHISSPLQLNNRKAMTQHNRSENNNNNNNKQVWVVQCHAIHIMLINFLPFVTLKSCQWK